MSFHLVLVHAPIVDATDSQFEAQDEIAEWAVAHADELTALDRSARDVRAERIAAHDALPGHTL